MSGPPSYLFHLLCCLLVCGHFCSISISPTHVISCPFSSNLHHPCNPLINPPRSVLSNSSVFQTDGSTLATFFPRCCLSLTFLNRYCSPELLLPGCSGSTESCSLGLPAASGEIVQCVPSTQSPWPGRGDGSLCPERERPQNHEQVSLCLFFSCGTLSPLSSCFDSLP